ncbi:MAG: carbohydrate kinase family protein [Chloroflexi bacterium]|nr:carbohydrate kinase family protein [Chloroflexota bacterium]
MSRKLIVYGDIGMDIFVQVEALPHIGQDAIAREIALLPAGSAANCAAVAAKLGTAVEFVGLTGRDELAAMLIADLRHCQVGLHHLRQVAGPAAVIIAVVDARGERTMLSHRGVSTQVAYGELAPDLIGPADCLHLSGYSFQDPISKATALACITQARAQGAQITLDPSFHFAREFKASHADALQEIDFIFPNQEEATLMSGVDDPVVAAAMIRTFGPKTVIVKLGGQGCLIASAQGTMHVPARAVKPVVDTTGAGDAFCGGFLAAWLRGLAIDWAAKVGHAAAAQVIGQPGGRAGAPTRAILIEQVALAGDLILADILRRL